VPELPDLLHVEKVLRHRLLGARVESVRVEEPIVLRCTVPGDLTLLVGHTLRELYRKSHFVVFEFRDEGGGYDLAVNPMLAGRFRLSEPSARREGSSIFALRLSGGPGEIELRYLDDKKMGKAYLTLPGGWGTQPGLQHGGVDVLSPDFTLERFRALVAKRRDQVRVFLLDKKALDSLGNAYADEVLWAAGIHPKTWCRSLSADDVARLHASIVSVLRDAADEVARRNGPPDVKVRDFLKVRLKDACPRCGSKIRTAGVKGMDACFCPVCQPATRSALVDWRKTGV
jgi:formamidopyrimidine-DNA glycosylase